MNEKKATANRIVLKSGVIYVSVFYFSLTVDYLITRGASPAVCIVGAFGWALLLTGVIATRW